MNVIEALVAIVIGSMIALSATAMYAQTLQTTSQTTNQMAADQIGKAVLDFVRTFTFQTISGWSGRTFNLSLNTASGQGPPPHPVILGDDTSLNNWTAPSLSNAFPGTATVQFEAGLIPATEQVTVTVTWSDSQAMLPHTATYSAVIFEQGENYWSQ